MHDERPMPEITVRDPNRPDRYVDVLESGPERPPADPAVRRRRQRILGALLLVGALVVAGVEVRERRAEAAEERRLGAIVELRAEHEGGSASFDTTSRTGRLTLQVLLHNDGPLDVSVTAATVAGYDLAGGGHALVAAGRSARMLLERTVSCDGSTAPTTAPGGLRLTVRTVTTERPVNVDFPVDETETLRLCGFRPLETLHMSFGAMSRPAPEVIELELELATQAVGAVHLAAVTPPNGVAIDLLVQGQHRRLPLELASSDGLTRTLSVTLRFTVHDCSAARAWPTADVPAPQAPSRSALLVQVRDHEGSVGDALVRYPGGLLDSLIGESCG